MLELLELRGDAAFHRRHTPDLPEALELLEPGEVAPGDWADLQNTYRLTDLPTCFDTAAIYQADEEHPGRLWPVVEVSFLTVRIDLGAVQVLRLRRQLGRVWRAKVSTPAERVLRGKPPTVVLGFDDFEDYPIAIDSDDSQDQPSLIELEPDEICEGDLISLEFAFDTGPKSDVQDSAASYLNRNYPDRLWKVYNASMLLIQIDSYKELGFNTKLYRRNIKKAYGLPRCQLTDDFDQDYEIGKILGVVPITPQPQPKNSSRDALGRGRGDGRRGAVRSVTLTRKRKGGGIWTGEQHQLQWEEGGAKKTRYLRKAIAPQVRADWEAGATVLELLEKYKLVEPKHV
jgi:hypothetical protein